jgi:hypothetical protein
VLFGKVILPRIVAVELSDPAAPRPSSFGSESRPVGLKSPRLLLSILWLASTAGRRPRSLLSGDLLLIDDRAGVRAAKRRGLRVTGTLGVLDLAAERGLA